MSNHTKGPWKARDGIVQVVGGGPDYTFYAPGESAGEMRANAHLIAVAPEMYEAASMAARYLRQAPQPPDRRYEAVLMALDRALKKAAGRTLPSAPLGKLLCSSAGEPGCFSECEHAEVHTELPAYPCRGAYSCPSVGREVLCMPVAETPPADTPLSQEK